MTLYSRRQNVLNQKFRYVATALQELPDDTVLDGELVEKGFEVCLGLWHRSDKVFYTRRCIS
jgi:ATP-dependent DNA ligase